METHYKGPTIRVSAVRIPQNGRWTVRSWVSWASPNDSVEKMIVHTDLEFGNPEEALQARVDFAMKVDNREQDFLTER